MELQLICDRRSGKRIELVVPTYNEEHRIAPFIRYYRNTADVVIFDDSSSDRTCEIAQALGASVYRRSGPEKSENHFVHYLHHLSLSQYGIYMAVDELIPLDDLKAADEFLRQKKGVLYGKRVDYMFGHRTRAFVSVAPRGFFVGSVTYDSSRIHAPYIIHPEFRAQASLTIEIQHLQVWHLPDTLIRGGVYVSYDVKTLLKSKRQLFAFSKMYIYPVARFMVRGFWKEPFRISLYYWSLTLLNLAMGLTCYLESKWFPSKEEQINQYNRMFESHLGELNP